MAWREGMLLRPHHLQHHDLYLHERLQGRLASVDPYSWGVGAIALDENALSDHRIVVVGLDAILPDGTAISCPSTVQIEEKGFDPASERTDVYLGLPLLRHGANNLEGSGAEPTRFVSHETEIADLHRANASERIQLAQPNPVLLTDADAPDLDGYDAFKLLEIHATGNAEQPFALNAGFSPPVLTLQAWPPLLEAVKAILSQIAAKTRQATHRTSRFGPRDMPAMFMRYTLARLTPLLRHLLESEHTRPAELYTVLVEALGAVSALRIDDAERAPRYDHTDPMASYAALIEKLEEHLKETIPTGVETFEMPVDSERNFHLTKELDATLRDPDQNRFYLGVRSRIERSRLIREVQKSPLGAPDDVEEAMIFSRDTLPLRHEDPTPVHINPVAGYEYFSIDAHHAKWDLVKKEFGINLSAEVESPDVCLVVVTDA